jgi:TRAP transporter TAXI family solute receptor
MTFDFMAISRRAALAGTAAAFLGARVARAEKQAIVFGSTNATSSNYALAVAMTKAIKQDLPDVNVTMIETGASVDNIRRMMKDEIDFGLVMADTIIQATDGVGPFKGRAVTDLGVLYVHDAASWQFAVRADAGVNDLKDLQGKRFSAGIHGSGAELLTREMMRVLSIEPNGPPARCRTQSRARRTASSSAIRNTAWASAWTPRCGSC